MTALLYFLVAVAAAALSARAWMLERDEPARVAFLALGWSVAISYLGFSLSLLPGLGAARLLYMVAGSFVPAGALWTVDRMFARPDEPRSPWVGRLYAITLFCAPGLTIAHGLWFFDIAGSSPIEILLGLFVFASFGFTVYRLRQAWFDTTLRVDKARLLYLMAVVGGAIVFTLIEQTARTFAPVGNLQHLSLASRGLVLQGAVPPFSALLTAVALYFLYHTLVLYRLVDLYEALSRLAALLFSAGLLVLVDGVTFIWVGTFTDYPFHSTFQIFLGSLVFLAAYDPARENIAWWSNRLFNQRGQQLATTLDAIRGQLSAQISAEGLTDTLLSGLHASGRVPICSIYVWNTAMDAFVCLGAMGLEETRPLKAVASHPFTREFSDGLPWYSRSAVARRARTDEDQAEILQLMNAMHADVTVPFVSGGTVLGWFNVRDEEWSDGFSADEIQRFRAVADTGAVVLSNIEDIQALEEEHRLAALGAMAAGLAHEIRNPLAGLKGAAQFLAGTDADLDEDADDMLQVIVDEANRLDRVVSQFLDYARPFELDLAPDHINALVTRSLNLLRAQGVPIGISLDVDLLGDLPSSPMDSTKLGQVLLNLLQNALQAMPDGGELRVTTRRRAKRGLDWVEVVVSDTGVGIDPKDMEHLFVPFWTTKKRGTGLGLPISQRIVQAHGGEVEANSIVGRGTTFVIRLPLPQEYETEEDHTTDEGTAEPAPERVAG